MQQAPISQADRLAAAARIKAIGEGNGPFSAHDADALHALLHDLPEQGSTASFTFKRSGPKTRGAAAGVGNVDIDGREKVSKWAVGEKEFRCGAYVVTRDGKALYLIRHVGEVDADYQDGYLVKLERGLTGWNAYLNKPWRFAIGPVVITIGGRFVFWKAGR
ncbi:MAG: hypothetical protein V4618_16700 [Pseudomonadota bacterium]